MYGRTNEWVGGWVDRQKDGWMDGRTDGGRTTERKIDEFKTCCNICDFFLHKIPFILEFFPFCFKEFSCFS